MYCMVCWNYPKLANIKSPLYKGTGANGKYRLETLKSHNGSANHLSLSTEVKWIKGKLMSNSPNYLKLLSVNLIKKRKPDCKSCLILPSIYIYYCLLYCQWELSLQQVQRTLWFAGKEWSWFWKPVQERKGTQGLCGKHCCCWEGAIPRGNWKC